MNALVLYDSAYGNTEKVAKSIGDAMAKLASVRMLPVGEAKTSDLEAAELLVVGSPTHGGRPTPAIETLIKDLPPGSLKDVKVAAFDTRFDPEEHGLGLRLLMNVIRFAAGKIAKALTSKGGQLIAEPEGFIVEDKAGPLKTGELEHAAKWAKMLCDGDHAAK
jgi:flavodoxin